MSAIEQAEFQIVANDIAASMGLPLKNVAMEEVDNFLPFGVKDSEHVSCLMAFTLDVAPGTRFAVLGCQNPGEHYDVLIMTEEGFQVYPPDVRDAFNTGTKERAVAALEEELVMPFVYRMAALPEGKFTDWLKACRAQRSGR